MWVWIASCAAEVPEVPVSEQIDPTTWRFPTEEHRRRWLQTREALAARFAGGVHADLARTGNFLRESWRSADAEASLAVLHAPKTYPDVFGLVLDGVASRDGSTVTVHWSMGGEKITGDVAVVTLATPAGELELSSEARWVVGMDTLRTDPAPAAALIADLARSPESFRARGAERVAALASKVRAHLSSGTARRCEYGPPRSGGLPPECTAIVALTTLELAAERERIAEWVTAGEAVLLRPELPALVAEQVPASLR
jgi:hypothetical protein